MVAESPKNSLYSDSGHGGDQELLSDKCYQQSLCPQHPASVLADGVRRSRGQSRANLSVGPFVDKLSFQSPAVRR